MRDPTQRVRTWGRRAARRALGLVGPLRRRFVILLVLLAALSLVPWFLASHVHQRLEGFGVEMDRAGSLRHRLATLALVAPSLPAQQGAAADRIRSLSADQRRDLRTLIDGNPGAAVRPCRTAELCRRFESHLTRWDQEIVPLASRALAGSSGDAALLEQSVPVELERVDRTVHLLAGRVEQEVNSAHRAGEMASGVSLLLVLLVLLGIWGVFGRLERLRAGLGTEGLPSLARDQARAPDEVGALAGALGDAIGQLRARSEVDRARLARARRDQHIVTGWSDGLNRWLVGGEDLGSLLGEMVDRFGLEGAWAQVEEAGHARLIGATGLDVEQWERDVAPWAVRHTAASMRQERADAEGVLSVKPADVPAAARRGGWSTVVLVPLGWGDCRLGVLGMAGTAPLQVTPPQRVLLHVIGQILSLAIMARRLERRVRVTEQVAAMGGIARMLAHEVRNPLNSMSLHVRLLERRLGQLPSDGAEAGNRHLEVLKAELARLDDLVEDYVALGPGRPLRAEPVDLREVVREVVEVHEPAMAERGVILRLDAGAEATLADVDRPRIAQVLHNLVRNAGEALEGVEEPRVEVVLAHDGDTCQVRVCDTGPGVADPEHVFSPSYTTKPCGTGMGLSISRRIAELHGGQLLVRSPPGSGAEFVLTLPRRRGAQDAESDLEGPAAPRAAP